MIKTKEKFIYNPPQEPYLTVLHHDDDMLILSKPSGLLSVPGKAEDHADCLEARAQERYPQARTVHRLDMATSGLVVMAMNAAAHRHLGLQFERRHVKKSYVARVWGHMEDDNGTIDLPLICDWPNRPMQKVCYEHGKAAQTEWEMIEREERGMTKVRLFPYTGRSHQLRVHMLSLGHPILGDEFYAHEEALTAADHLQLHAESLMLYHPVDGRVCEFVDPCPF